MASWALRVPLSLVPCARPASRAVTSKAGSSPSGPSRESGATAWGGSGTGALRRPSAPRVAEAAGAALARWQLLHQAEPGRLHPLDHQLGDAVTAAHPVGGAGVGVDEQDADLVTVAGVDQPRRVEAGHPVGEGQPAAGLDEPRVPVG